MREFKSLQLRCVSGPDGNWYFLDDLCDFVGNTETKLLTCLRIGNRRTIQSDTRCVVVDAVGVIEILVRMSGADTEAVIKEVIYGAVDAIDTALGNYCITPPPPKATSTAKTAAPAIKHSNKKFYCSDDVTDLVSKAIIENEVPSQRELLKLLPCLSLVTINRAMVKLGAVKDEYGFYIVPSKVGNGSPPKAKCAEPKSDPKPKALNKVPEKYFKYVSNETVANSIRDIRSGKITYKLQEIYQFMSEEDVALANQLYDDGRLV